MRTLVFSDVHGELGLLQQLVRKMPELSCDFALFCGDVVRGSARGEEWLSAKREQRDPDPYTPAIQTERAEDYALYAEFCQALRSAPFRIFAVPGNMDAPEGRYLTAALADEGKDSPVEVVHRSLARMGEYVICGLGGEITEADREEYFVLQYPRWEANHCFQLFEHVEGPRIMVLHTPPVGEVVDRDKGGHKGCQVVNELINTWRPVLAVCGHAHDAYGSEVLGDTLVVNPGALKSGHYAVVDIEEKQVELAKL